MKGGGRVHRQSVIDTDAKLAFAKLYDRERPIAAAEIRGGRVVPFSDEPAIRLSRLPTDRGTEFCGSESHDYELYLAVEDIEHTRPKTKSPQTGGICERFHRMVLDAFYRAAFRKKICRTIDELQADLDAWPRCLASVPGLGAWPRCLASVPGLGAWIVEYNERQRPHQGRCCFGKTPTQTFRDALPLAKEKRMAA